MSSLEDRLRKLRSIGVTKGARGLRPRRKRRIPVEQMVPGRVIANEAGEFYLVERRFSADHEHGRLTVGDLLQHPKELAACLARDVAIGELWYDQAVFLDIETIGLSGGTGTVAFMVGVGFYDGDCLRVQQFFMRDYPEEPAMLLALRHLLDDFAWVVSFNGRAFDLPLMTTRFLMNRMPPPLSAAPHLDLLFPARRLWKRRLPSRRLGALEKDILAFYRDQEDIPGYLVPQVYFDYLRTGDAREIAGVFYHNLYDVVSLAALAAYMCRLLDAPHLPPSAHPEDVLWAGSLLDEAGKRDRAEMAYRQAVELPLSPEAREEALRRLALLYKRSGRRHEAREIWHALTEARFGADVASLVELAKDYEHRTREYEEAIRCVEMAIERVSGWEDGPRRRRALAELDHRMNRLLRKRARARQGGAGVDIQVSGEENLS